MSNKAMPSMQVSSLKKNEVSLNSPALVDSNGSAEVEDVLEAPNHEVNSKPSLLKPSDDNDSSVDLPKSHSKGIEVVALRKGFYNQNRIKENEKFTVKSFEELGEWMKCLDPDIEKEKNKFFKEKKASK